MKTMSEVCEWPFGCKRKATTHNGWDGSPYCLGHHRLGNWNKATWGWDDFDEDYQNKLLVRRLAIKEWFRQNPNPKEVEETI